MTLLLLVGAGCGDQADEPEAPAVGEEANGTAAGEANGTAGTAELVTFVAVDIAYEEAPDTLPPGAHTFELVNEGDLLHTVAIESLDEPNIVEADAGETATGEVELDTGSYVYYCTVPGHREAGMEGTLEVTEEG